MQLITDFKRSRPDVKYEEEMVWGKDKIARSNVRMQLYVK
jgi:hypothetical protein